MRPSRIDRDFALRDARQRATAVLARHRITSLPVDPFFIARERKISVRRATGLVNGVLGYIDYLGDNQVEITLSEDFHSAGLINFTLGHELGHFHLEGHFDQIFAAGVTRHESRGGYASAELYEQQADAFAAELLMPTGLCRALLDALPPDDAGLPMILALAETCGTSVHAAANRYVDLADRPTAVIVSSGGAVEYCARSSELFEAHQKTRVGGPTRGAALPRSSLASLMHNHPQHILDCHRPTPIETTWAKWFHHGTQPVCEEAIGLGSYGKVITVLTANSWGDEDDDEDDETDGTWRD